MIRYVCPKCGDKRCRKTPYAQPKLCCQCRAAHYIQEKK
jgi:hypothetical protein